MQNNVCSLDLANSKNLGMCNTNKLVGSVSVRLLDAKKNEVGKTNVHNNIVLGIRKPIIKLLGGWSTSAEELPFVRQLALGTGDASPTIEDTGLNAEIEGSRKITATVPTISEDGLSVTFSFLYDMVDDAVDNQDIKEMGLYTSDGTMIARTTPGLIRKAPGLYLEVYWTIGYAQQ